jgi:hypothetical protein
MVVMLTTGVISVNKIMGESGDEFRSPAIL